MTRIAFVTPIFPYPLDTGIRIRIFYLVRHLGQRYKLNLVSLEPGDAAAVSSALGAEIEIAPSSRQQDLNCYLWEFCKNIRADVLHVEMDAAAARLGLPDRQPPIPVVLDSACTYHLAYLREAQYANSLVGRVRSLVRGLRQRRFESRLARVASVVIAVSEKEAQIVRALAPRTKVAVVPNGVDCETVRFQSLGKTILFCGAFTWGPNKDAALYFLREILQPLRAAGCREEVVLVGSCPDLAMKHLAQADGNVQLPGRVPDMTPWYAQAAVVINPMRGGGGTRLKVLEAMAAGRPVVTTSIGAEGLEVSDGRELFVADDPVAFAGRIRWLLRNRDAAEAMGRAGRLLVEERYDWTRCLAPLDSLYDGLLAAKRVVSC